MRRITFSIVSTLAVLVLLFSYKTSRNEPLAAATVVGSAHIVSGSGATSSSAGGPLPTSAAGSITVPSKKAAETTTTPAKTLTDGQSSSPATTNAAPTTAGPTTAAPTAEAPLSTANNSPVTVDGAAVDTRFGPVQVEVVVAAGRITKATAIVYPTENPRDAEINAVAIPDLQAQVIAAQSAQIDGVSGATYTTEGFITSLQSALDQVKFK